MQFRGLTILARPLPQTLRVPEVELRRGPSHRTNYHTGIPTGPMPPGAPAPARRRRSIVIFIPERGERRRRRLGRLRRRHRRRRRPSVAWPSSQRLAPPPAPPPRAMVQVARPLIFISPLRATPCPARPERARDSESSVQSS